MTGAPAAGGGAGCAAWPVAGAVGLIPAIGLAAAVGSAAVTGLLVALPTPPVYALPLFGFGVAAGAAAC